MTNDEFVRIAVLGMIPADANAKELFDLWLSFGKPRSVQRSDIFWLFCDQANRGEISLVDTREPFKVLLEGMSPEEHGRLCCDERTTRFVSLNKVVLTTMILEGTRPEGTQPRQDTNPRGEGDGVQDQGREGRSGSGACR